MKPAIQPPSAKRIAAAYGNLVSRQRIHQAVKKYGYPVVLNPDRMFTAMLGTHHTPLRTSLANPAKRRQISELLNTLTK